ncbi:aspartate ammonia-lyase [Amphritea sp. HPY]|uniref:aspartate ammonia-lyase n=1 Tax=Amphritea sp. HPY TaxID=3421652 RepID=UPI003D7E45FD
MKFRTEHDLLGDQVVPADALYGGQTARALVNFPITNIAINHFPHLIIALAMVKQAAARTNGKLKLLSGGKVALIDRVCSEILAGQWHDQFVVDTMQGGAGTSTNMNMNEVIANRASQLCNETLGSYQTLHPNNDVNLSQSTNDAYPTAVRLSILLDYHRLTNALDHLSASLKLKADEFSDVIKLGRTQLQDAVPMTLGQTFHAFHTTLKEESQRIERDAALFREVNLGATAIGTGINTHPDYAAFVIDQLAEISGEPLKLADDLIEATSDMGAFVAFSGSLKRTATKLSRICNDLRLMSSGPRGGFNEINLPPRQPGSSIMPGKVNPVIPEVVNQIAFQIIGKDVTVTMAAEAGQLELNVMEPVIAYNILDSLQLLSSAVSLLDRFCIQGISANKEHCRYLVEQSIGGVTALNSRLGYETTSKLAKKALQTGKSIRDLVIEQQLLSSSDVDLLLDPNRMLQPNLE